MPLSLETASLFLEAVALSLVVVAGFVGAVAEDSAPSRLPPEAASLFLEVVAAPVEVAFEAVVLFHEILSLLIEGVVGFPEVAAG